MCGITGYLSLDGQFEPARFAHANNLIQYRGPDDMGFVTFDAKGAASAFVDENLADYAPTDSKTIAALGFRRLAIIDLSEAGHQPMCDVTGRYWIVFNGEVYNYLELRAELLAAGYLFRSNSDTEVVLASYIHWGAACLQRFNGMWSLCIVDSLSKTMFCARDRFGIKPFNYYLDDSRFVFGSEVKQVQCLLGESREINSPVLLDFMIFGVKNHSEQTFYEGITELRGGQCLHLDYSDHSRVCAKLETWWDLKPDRFVGTEQEAADELLFLLTESTRIRLRSDVSMGTALSGGLDSTGLVALIDEISDAKQNVFTVVSQDKDLDELAFANQTIEKYRLNSYKTEFGEQNIKELERITFHHDQPVNSASIFGGWILQKLVKDSGVIVNLNGQGADELMGGYSRPPHALRYLDAMRSLSFVEASRDLMAGFQNSNRSLVGSAKILVEDIGRYMFRGPTYRVVSSSRSRLLQPEYASRVKTQSLFLNRNTRMHGLSSIQKQQAYAEIKFRNLPALLHNVDRDSMAHSLEARVPFLDYKVAEFVFSLPPAMLTRNGYTKHAYRRAMQDRIPPEILWDNNKKGFTTPRNNYLKLGRDYLKELVEETPEHSIINMDALRAINESSSEYGSPLHWRFLCTLIWMRVSKQNSYTQLR